MAAIPSSRPSNGEAKSIEKFDGLNNELYGAGWEVPIPLRYADAFMTFVSIHRLCRCRYLGGFLAVQGNQRRRHSGFHPVRRSFTQPIMQVAKSPTCCSHGGGRSVFFDFLDAEEGIA